MKELAMTNVRAVDFPPLEFLISLGPYRSFVVRERRGRSGGVFDELSDAVLFVRDECRARSCAVAMKFDQNLACIRAAG
jgi:predicted nucleotidyltransferase